jgi:hypothetical protein
MLQPKIVTFEVFGRSVTSAGSQVDQESWRLLTLCWWQQELMSEAVTDELVAQWYTTRKFRFSRGYHMLEEFLPNGPSEKAVRHSASQTYRNIHLVRDVRGRVRH